MKATKGAPADLDAVKFFLAASNQMKETEYEHRTDSLEEKIELLQSALEDGKLDRALSFAESMRQTLKFERQRQDSVDAPVSDADDYVAVSDLAASWSWPHEYRQP